MDRHLARSQSGIITVLILIALSLLSGCEAAATPIAAVSTASPAADAGNIPTGGTLPPPVRYGIAEAAARPLSDTMLTQLREHALVETIPPDADVVTTAEDAGYDIVVDYGQSDSDQTANWQSRSQFHTVLLLFNDALAPLDQPELRTLIQQSINPVTLADAAAIAGANPVANETLSAAQIRTQFANRGYPDGFRLTVAHTANVPIDTLTSQLNAVNIDTRRLAIDVADVSGILERNQAHLVIALATTPTQRENWRTNLDDSQPMTLYTLPVRYWLRTDIPITFMENGFPLPSP